jgi:hypothetical protein
VWKQIEPLEDHSSLTALTIDLLSREHMQAPIDLLITLDLAVEAYTAGGNDLELIDAAQ